jgi:hypothetical protein
VIRLILRCLDTRSALATAALSKHWVRFRRELPVLEFKVSDILPERYYRYLRRRQDTTTGNHKKLDVLMSRYERRSMRSMAISMNRFLDADEVDHGQGQRSARRSAHAMTLELFPGHNTRPFNRLVAKAVGDWGVQDLEIVVLDPTPCHGHDVSYSFPHHCFDDDLKSPTGLKKLKLTNCTPLPAHNADAPLGSPAAFSSLTMLVLQDMPKWTRGRVYQRIVRACPTLKSCLFWDLENISIDAPGSQIMELVVDGCTFVSTPYNPPFSTKDLSDWLSWVLPWGVPSALCRVSIASTSASTKTRTRQTAVILCSLTCEAITLVFLSLIPQTVSGTWRTLSFGSRDRRIGTCQWRASRWVM